MDVNQKYCQSCHLISRNGFIIRYVANVWAILSRYQNAAAASREYCKAISGKTPFWARLVINLV
jgi:cytochrome c2